VGTAALAAERTLDALNQTAARVAEFARAGSAYRETVAYHQQQAERLQAEVADLDRQIAVDETYGPPPWGLLL
jgi:hypothetical protein